MTPTPLLVLGLGNLLLRRRRRSARPPSRGSTATARRPTGVRVLDGGTLGLALLPYLEDADDVILVDAIRDDAPAGRLRAAGRRRGGAGRPATGSRRTRSASPTCSTARGWRGRYPRRLVLLGLVPLDLELGSSAPRGRAPAPGAGRASRRRSAALGMRSLADRTSERRCSGSWRCRSRSRAVGPRRRPARAVPRHAVPEERLRSREARARGRAVPRALRPLPRRPRGRAGVRREGLSNPPARLHRPATGAGGPLRAGSSS